MRRALDTLSRAPPTHRDKRVTRTLGNKANLCRNLQGQGVVRLDCGGGNTFPGEVASHVTGTCGHRCLDREGEAFVPKRKPVEDTRQNAVQRVSASP